MEEINHCKMCFETYGENLRPRCIYCGHSFCTSCLNNIIEDGKLACPKCKQVHRAVNACDFPINYDLEEMISNFKKALSNVASEDGSDSKSNKMQILIDEQKTSTENLILESEDLQKQIKEYDDHLLDKKTKHKEVFLKIKDLTNRNEVILKQIDDEQNNMSELVKEGKVIIESVKQKLPTLDKASSSKSAVVAIAELDKSVTALEKWHEYCHQQLPNAKIITSSEKVLVETMAAMSVVDTERDRVLKIPDLSSTNFSIIEKISKISGNGTLSVEMLKNMAEPLKNLMKAERVYAIQADKGSVRSARLSVKEDNIYLHYLQDGEPPSHMHTIKQSELVGSLNMEATTVFLDLAWNETAKGRVHILLSPATPLARHFRILCTGDLGPSYAHSKIYNISNKSGCQEYITGGDYEKNNGNGGASIIEGLKRDDGLNTRPCIPGIVYATQGMTDGPKSAQFNIVTGSGNYANLLGVFGQVQDGLDVLKAAVNEPVGTVKIIDCGVMLSLRS